MIVSGILFVLALIVPFWAAQRLSAALTPGRAAVERALETVIGGLLLIQLAVLTMGLTGTLHRGGFIGALSLGRRSALIVGVGMVPRGEVGVVIASLGLAAGVFSARTYALIVAMSLLTAMITPPVLALLLGRQPSDKNAGAK